MTSDLDQIRAQQRDTWDRFSAGWKKWDEMVLSWLAPFGDAMIRRANLKETRPSSMSPPALANQGSQQRRGSARSRDRD